MGILAFTDTYLSAPAAVWYFWGPVSITALLTTALS